MHDSLRLCVLSHLYPNPVQPTRGIFVQQHVRALVAAGVQVSVISPVPMVSPGMRWLSPRWRRLARIPPLAEYQEGAVRYPRFFTLPKALWRAREGASIARAVGPLFGNGGYDLIHAHTAVPDGQAARLLARERGVPFVCTVHGYDFLLLREPGAVREAVLRTFQAAARVVCVSERVRRACLEHDPRPDRFIVIHHGVTVPEESPPGTRELSAARPMILSAGNLIPQKGFAELVQAMPLVLKQVPEAHLSIAGEGPERDRLEALISSLGLGDHVSLLGRLPHEQLLDLYCTADVFCLISQDEGFGVVYLEAMAHGIPVVGSQGEGISDVVRHEQNGLLVAARGAEAAAAALLKLLTDSGLRARIGDAGRMTAAGLTWEKNAAEHIALYRDVIQTTHRGASPRR